MIDFLSLSLSFNSIRSVVASVSSSQSLVNTVLLTIHKSIAPFALTLCYKCLHNSELLMLNVSDVGFETILSFRSVYEDIMTIQQ